MNRQEILNELFKLYRLQQEGKNVQTLIEDLEEKLFEKCTEELDAEKDDEEN